ncbi:MAG: Hsp70 family protein, partial [Sphingomonadaceae bacterium]
MIVGIDLGTTNSLIAVWENGSSRLIPNSLGEVLTPSCVSVDEDGSILVGRAARERLQTHPAHSAAVFKRYMGSDKTLRL